MGPDDSAAGAAGELQDDGEISPMVFVIGGRRWVARTEMYIQPFDDAQPWGGPDRRAGADRRRSGGPWQGDERRQGADRRLGNDRRQGG